jgi:pimeloyl-ACP methyl ester carboxylesterase
LPGHGQSDKPAKKDAYGLQLVEDVALLLDQLKIEKAHIVGYSLGGMVALKFIAKHPERSLSGCLGGMGWLRDGSGLQKFWDLLGRRGGGEGPGPPPEFMQGISELALTEPELRAIKTPVEVLIGSRDPVKRLYVDALTGVRKDWPVVEISGAGHMDCILKSDFREELAKWIRKAPK